jgi:hypothetical protein
MDPINDYNFNEYNDFDCNAEEYDYFVERDLCDDDPREHFFYEYDIWD